MDIQKIKTATGGRLIDLAQQHIGWGRRIVAAIHVDGAQITHVDYEDIGPEHNALVIEREDIGAGTVRFCEMVWRNRFCELTIDVDGI